MKWPQDETRLWCSKCGDYFTKAPESKTVRGCCEMCANDILEREEHSETEQEK